MLKTLATALLAGLLITGPVLAQDIDVDVSGTGHQVIVVDGGVYVDGIFYPRAAEFEAAPFCVTKFGNFPSTAQQPYHVPCTVQLLVVGSVKGWTGDLTDLYYFPPF